MTKTALAMTAKILDATGYPDVQSLDRGVASDFRVSPLAVRSARHILEEAVDEPSPLPRAIDDVFAARPEYKEPVRRIARYLETFVAP